MNLVLVWFQSFGLGTHLNIEGLVVFLPGRSAFCLQVSKIKNNLPQLPKEDIM